MEEQLNSDQIKIRDKILGLSESKYLYGVGDFDKLSLDGLNELLKNNFISLKKGFNYAPKVEAFFNFMSKYPFFTCIGFSTRRRNDYCVVITGIEAHNVEDKDAIIDFCITFRKADEFKATKAHCRAWYD